MRFEQTYRGQKYYDIDVPKMIRAIEDQNELIRENNELMRENNELLRERGKEKK